MSKQEHHEEIIDRIIDIESFENEVGMWTKLKALKNKTYRIRSGLDELKNNGNGYKRKTRRNKIGINKSKGKDLRFKIGEIK